MCTRGSSLGEAVTIDGSVYPVADESVTDARLLSERAAAILGLKDRCRALCSALTAATFIADAGARPDHIDEDHAAAWSREA